jgi:hypothetical protein
MKTGHFDKNENNIYSLSINTFDKNISSYYGSLKSKLNFPEESTRINHLFLKESIVVGNLEEYRYFSSKLDIDLTINHNEYISDEEKKKRYNNEEDEVYCGRFPHLQYCGCGYPCSILLNKISPIEVSQQIYAGPIESAYKTKELLKLKITHILNVSCLAYNKRKYFKYLDIYIGDNHTENAIKFFKITNRFIEDAIKKDQKILIHSINGKSRCWVFLMAYLIGKLKMKYLVALDFIREKFPYAEPNENFLTQLKHYDLETNV